MKPKVFLKDFLPLSNDDAEYGCVYAIVSPEGRVYIGRTVDFRGRMRTHAQVVFAKRVYAYHDTKAYKGMREDTAKGMALEVIVIEEDVPVDTLDEREKWWIDKLETHKTPLYNTTTKDRKRMNTGWTWAKK